MTRAPSRPEADTTAGTRDRRAARRRTRCSSRAVEEAARLLQADGAMVYLVDGRASMRFAVDAGIRNPEAQQLIRDLSLPIGVGLFGHVATTGETLVVAGDYRRDKRFEHSPVADRIVTIANMRSMAAAPLIAEGEVHRCAGGVLVARSTTSTRPRSRCSARWPTTPPAAIANQRLIERLASLAGGAGASGRRAAHARRDRGQHRRHPRAGRDPPVGGRGRPPAHRLRRRPPDAHASRRAGPATDASWSAMGRREDRGLARAASTFPVDEGINGLAAGTRGGRSPPRTTCRSAHSARASSTSRSPTASACAAWPRHRCVAPRAR